MCFSRDPRLSRVCESILDRVPDCVSANKFLSTKDRYRAHKSLIQRIHPELVREHEQKEPIEDTEDDPIDSLAILNLNSDL